MTRSLGKGVAPVVRVAVLTVVLAASQSAGAVEIVLNYAYDTNGFFTTNPDARDRIEDAAAYFETFADSLDALVPNGPNTWSEPAAGTTGVVARMGQDSAATASSRSWAWVVRSSGRSASRSQVRRMIPSGSIR